MIIVNRLVVKYNHFNMHTYQNLKQIKLQLHVSVFWFDIVVIVKGFVKPFVVIVGSVHNAVVYSSTGYAGFPAV